MFRCNLNSQNVYLCTNQDWDSWLVFTTMFTEPSCELLVPHVDQHLRPHHVGPHVVHLLPLVVAPCSLPVVVLGEDLHLGRVGAFHPRVELVHVNPTFFGCAGIQDLVELLAENFDTGVLLHQPLVQVDLVADQVGEDVVEFRNFFLHIFGLHCLHIKRLYKLRQCFKIFSFIFGLELLLIGEILFGVFALCLCRGGGRPGIFPTFLQFPLLLLSFGCLSLGLFLHLEQQGVLGLDLFLPLLLGSPHLLDVLGISLSLLLPLHHGLLHGLLLPHSCLLQLHHHLPLPVHVWSQGCVHDGYLL